MLSACCAPVVIDDLARSSVGRPHAGDEPGDAPPAGPGRPHGRVAGVGHDGAEVGGADA